METKTILVYRPKDLEELKKVPQGGLVELFQNGLAVFLGQHNTLDLPRVITNPTERFFNFLYRNRDEEGLVIWSVLERSIRFGDGQIIAMNKVETQMSRFHEEKQTLYTKLDAYLKQNLS